MIYTAGADMRWLHWVALCVLGAIMVGGCSPKQEEEPAPTAAPMSDDALAAYRRKHPEALIGRVMAVLPEHRLVSVGDVSVVDFKRGDTVVFLGASDQQLTTGEVVNIVKERIHVKYNDPSSGGRAPQVRDLVVRFKK
jgi:hypothetical protein